VIYLKDLADISRGYVDPFENKVYSDQTPAIALAVSLRVGGNVSKLGEDVLALLDRMSVSYPIGVEFDVVMMQSEVVEEKIDDFVSNIFQSLGIVLVIMLIVFGLRTGMIVASLIPMTILTTFVLMSFFGVWIDQISLAALIIALGMLVDNAIVMTESIIYKVTKGETIMAAAMNSAKELWVSLLTS